MIVTAALDNIEGENANVIDKSKVTREKQKSRKQCMDSNKNANVISLYFDSRKDHTLLMEESGTKRIRREVIKEHVTVLAEPGSRYLGHFAPSSGNAKNNANSPIKFCKEKQIDINKIQFIECDGTDTNVGWKTGVIRLEKFKRPLHWIICQLHGNELTLRHLLIYSDRKTSKPTQFTGPIGKPLNETIFENLQVVNFQPIPAEAIDVSEEYFADLSSDQKYLLEMYRAVSSGLCQPTLASLKPGKMTHSPWLTTAARALRLYVSTEKPSCNFKLVVQYIMMVYTPMWFKIKRNHTISQAPLHVFDTIFKCQKLLSQVREIVITVTERNAFGAHHESILAAMVSQTNLNHNEIAWRRILCSREQNISDGRIRQLQVPKLNINANSYIDLIDWTDTIVSEPSFTAFVTSKEIKEKIKSKLFSEFKTPELPCHTQSVECHIKLVSEESSSVCDHASREGLIRNKLSSRATMLCFNMKSQYKTLK